MRIVRNYTLGAWRDGTGGFVPLVDPCSEEPIAQASSHGVDFGEALDWARREGGRTLRAMSFAERGTMLNSMSRALSERRDDLIAESVRNTGTTRRDAKFDVDGAIFTLAHYGQLGVALGERVCLLDGEGEALGRSARLWGQHVLVPLHGVAVQINAFNFPAWGLAEKAACALLAGVPVISKPATSTCLVAEQCFEALVGLAPSGALSLICGSTGDLIDRLGEQDVLAFTGSAATALGLRSRPSLLRASTRVNVEADSLNAAVLGPDVETSGETWDVFLRDVEREITQKTGQKCTAVRRILVPRERVEAVQAALIERLSSVVPGHPDHASTTMGPLTTASQLADAQSGVERLAAAAEIVLGSGRRVDGAGSAPGRGYFFGPTLLRARDAAGDEVVHTHEVFGPVATIVPFDGGGGEAAELVARAGGSLVSSIYSDDRAFLGEYLRCGGSSSGRLYIGSAKVAAQLPGSGVAMPQLLHGGPGRAGGGTELGGMRGLRLYLQCVALSGDRALLERLTGARHE